MRDRLRNAGLAAGVAFVLTIIFCLATTFLPMRFDVKTFGALLPREPFPAGFENVIFVSPDRGWESGHIRQYALSLFPEPLPSVSWIVFAEGNQPSDWEADGSVDRAGILRGHAPLSFGPKTLILVRDQSTRDELLKRLPAAATSPTMIDDVPRRPMFARPYNRWSLVSFIRLFVFILAGVLVCSYAYTSGGATGAAVGLPLFCVVHVTLTYLLGFLTPRSIELALAVEIIIGVILQRSPLPRPILTRRNVSIVLLLAIAMVFSAIRLDFDGDVFTHWLPIARAHHARGSHDLPFLRAQFGGGHRVAYPASFPIYLSTLMWVADVPQSTFDLGPALDRFDLLYRFATALLQILLLTAVAMMLGGNRAAIIAAASIAFAFPLLLGRPEAAESFLVPLVGFAAVALEGETSWTRRVGLILAGSLLFIKADSILILALLLLPWYAMTIVRQRPGIRALVADGAFLVASSLPFAVLRIEQARLGIITTFDFKPLTIESLRSGLPSLSLILTTLLKNVLAFSPWLILLAVAATLLFLLVRHRFAEAGVSIGVLLFAAVLGFLYLFSARDVVWHIATSYARVLDSALLIGALHVFVIALRTQPAGFRPSAADR